MNKKCIIFGGSGYIGRCLAKRLATTNRFQSIWLVDLNPPNETLPPNVRFVRHDVRDPIAKDTLNIDGEIDWIFNLAAVHREPGHKPSEYFRTNIPSARNIIAFARSIACEKIFFTSSIAVYGPTSKATDEDSPLEPITPYGISKLCSELIFETWLSESLNRRLIVARPGVIYGPGDPGNIGRLIKAVKKKRFAFPGRKDIRKSYGYIEGLLDSIEFTLDRDERHITYNYVEKDTLPLNEVVREIAEMVKVKVPTMSIPIGLLASTASFVQFVTAGNSPIHPVRVRKAATQTWIVPKKLEELGFEFRYNLRESLKHWNQSDPTPFA